MKIIKKIVSFFLEFVQLMAKASELESDVYRIKHLQ